MLRVLLASALASAVASPFFDALAPADRALLARGAGAGVRPPSLPGLTLTVSVIALGGDPTGLAASDDAFDAALAAAAALQNRSAAGSEQWVLGSHRVVIDLGGGLFQLARPLALHGSNASLVTVSGGALLAAPSFPRDAFLVDIDSWAMGVVLCDLVLDAAHRGGGIRVNLAEQTTVARVFVSHYATHGILGDDVGGESNELLILDSFLGEFQWGEPGYNVTAMQTGTGIELRFCDSHVVNVIVRCSKVGVVDAAGGNLWEMLHVYATCNKAGTANVAPGMIVAGEGIRIAACNFDDSPVILMGDGVDILLSGSIFYGLSGLVIAPQQHAIPWARGVVVTGNAFRGTAYAPNPSIAYDSAAGSFDVAHLDGFLVADNSFSEGATARTTRATVVIPVSVPAGGAPPCAGFAALVNVSEVLLFQPPPAPAVQYAPAVAAAMARVAARQRLRSTAALPRHLASPPMLFSPGVASLTGAVTLAAGGGAYGVFNAAPTAEFAVFNLTATRLWAAGAPATCDAMLGAVTLQLDQATPMAVGVAVAARDFALTNTS